MAMASYTPPGAIGKIRRDHKDATSIDYPEGPINYPVGPDGDVHLGWFVHEDRDRLMYEIGASYMSGLVGGSIVGGGIGLWTAHQKKYGYGFLAFNQVLNNGSRHGGTTANTFGVFGQTTHWQQTNDKRQVRSDLSWLQCHSNSGAKQVAKSDLTK